MDDEIRAHLAMAERDRIEHGEAPADARMHARREFGNVLAVQEVTRDAGGWPALARLAQDVRHALRRLRLSPATGAGAIVMLGLAVGITTAMFTIVDALLLRPVPFRDPDRLINVFMGTKNGGASQVAPSVFTAWRASGVFEAVEAATPDSAILTTPAGPVVRDTAMVSPGFFDMLGARPLRGRLFGPEDSHGERGRVVVISEDLWRDALAGDPGVLGRTVIVDNEPLEVVGVLPSAFRFPRSSIVLWRPMDFARQPPAGSHRPAIYVRVARNLPIPDALTIATDRAHAADPSTAKLSAVTFPFAGMARSYSGSAVTFLGWGVIVVFLVLAANVSSLLLTRLSTRRREFSLCAALGASRGRLIRQALVENVVVATLGATLGVAVAWVLVSAARAGLPESVLSRTLNSLDLDLRALAMAVAAATFATLAAGVAPAILATRVSPASAQALGDRGRTETRGARVFTRCLLIGEVAFACTLLVGSALLVRSFLNVMNADRGFDPRGVIEVAVAVDSALTPDPPSRKAAMDALEAGLRTLPGVSNAVQWAGGGLHYGEWRSDLPNAPEVRIPTVDEKRVGRAFFDMYGVKLLRGRDFQPGDTGDVAVVGERMAAALWPGQDPIGHSMTFGKQRFQVIGVASETNQPSLDPHRDAADLYTPLVNGGGRYRTISIRCAGTCPSEGLIRERARAATATARVYQVEYLEQTYADELAQPRATAAVALVFGAIALIAVAGGLFSVLSAAVARRRRELGVRAALGASPGQLRWVVLGDGLTVAGAGIGIGAVAGWLLMRLLTPLQYGVSPSDPTSWAVVLATLLVTTIAGAWRPARHAMRVDPAMLLREE